MVNFSNQSPFLQVDGSYNPVALCSTHERSLELLKTVMQVGVGVDNSLMLVLDCCGPSR